MDVILGVSIPPPQGVSEAEAGSCRQQSPVAGRPFCGLRDFGAGLGAPSGQILALSLPGPGSPVPEPLRARGSSSGSQMSLMGPRGEQKSPL